METWIHDMIREHDPVNDFFQHQEELESEYESYCNHCDGEPLSYDVWLHTDITFRDEDLPF
jgi:hypothetical protein